MTYLNPKRAVYSGLLAVLFASCRQGTPTMAGAMTSLAGQWKITKVLRNWDDITAGNDFGQSLITLDADNTYTLSRAAIFVVDQDGRWFSRVRTGGYSIILEPREAGHTSTYEIMYDSSGGTKNMTVLFSTASGNTYRYTLEKVNP